MTKAQARQALSSMPVRAKGELYCPVCDNTFRDNMNDYFLMDEYGEFCACGEPSHMDASVSEGGLTWDSGTGFSCGL
jgi:hypothetical protein